MRRGHLMLLLAVLAVTASCRGLPFGNRLQKLPLEPATAQHQLRFDCDFKLPPDSGLVDQLQAERDVIYTTLALPPSDEPIYVHLFRNEEDYQEHLQHKFPMVPNRRAFFVEVDSSLHVYAHSSDRWAEDLRHEVAHGYLHASVPAIPLWIDEGLAEYFEVPSTQQGLNHPHLMLLADLIEHNGWKPDLKQLESLNSAGEMQQVHYAEAWAWVYFLLNTTPERRELLTNYLVELREKGRAAPLSGRLFKPQQDLEREFMDFVLARRAREASHQASLRKTSP
ncbi:MAG: DUF1570 domain-containing protein [Pirellulales bacterium]